MTGIEPVPPGSPGAMPGSGVTPQQAGNFVRNLETPKYGVDAYVQSRIAEGAGSRELRGNSRKGFVYTAGPYKGLTEGQAMERARREYAGMNPQQRVGYEQRAQGGDVMSATEKAQTNQNYAARGVAAMGAAGMPVAGRGVQPVIPGQPQASAPAAPVAPVAVAGPPERMSMGTINGRPVMDIRAERMQKQQGLQPVPPAASPSRSAAQQAADAYNVMQGTQGPPKKLATPPGEKARLQFKADYNQGPPKELKSPERIYSAPSNGEKMIAQAGVQPVPSMNPSPTPPAAPKATTGIEPVPPMAKAKAMGESASFRGAVDRPVTPSSFANTEKTVGLAPGSIDRAASIAAKTTAAFPNAVKNAAVQANQQVASGIAGAIAPVAAALKAPVQVANTAGQALGENLIDNGVRPLVDLGEAIGKDLIARRRR